MLKIKKFLKNYDEFFYTPDSQLSFFKNLIGNNQTANIIDIEGGTSPIGVELSKNAKVTVTESHKDFDSLLKKEKKHNPNFNFYNYSSMDIARIFGRNKFDIAFCINSRLLAVQDTILLTKFLFDAKIILKDKGILVLDIYNFNNLQFTNNEAIFTKDSRSNTDKLQISIIRNDLYYYMDASLLKKKKEISIIENEPTYPFTMQHIQKIAKEINYSSVEFYSDYNKTPFKNDSQRLICILKK